MYRDELEAAHQRIADLESRQRPAGPRRVSGKLVVLALMLTAPTLAMWLVYALRNLR